MNRPVGRSTTILSAKQPHPESRPFPAILFGCRAELLAWTASRLAFTRIRTACLISPGLPYSILPANDLADRALVIWQEGQALPWQGVRCRFLQVGLGLPVEGEAIRPFTLWALVPLEEPPDWPPLLQLGAEFLTATRARLTLDAAAPAGGVLEIPY